MMDSTMNKPLNRIDLEYQLNDRYEHDQGQVFMTGTHALVRIPMLQAALDKQNGLNTAGFISGYRGSPLGNYDNELWRAQKYLDKHNIVFKPGINEELGATAVLGSQQVEASQFKDYDGVFGIWYGKGPGVDRAGDALKHGNAFGASPTGGVLVVAGDDHGSVSSSMNHQSEQVMESWMMPVLAPSDIQDYLEFGLYGFALSRYSGCWSGFIAVSEVVESAATVNLDIVNKSFVIPPREGYDESALYNRWPDPFPMIETRLMDHKLKAVDAFSKANPIDKMIWDSPTPKLGIVSCSKGHLDLMEALRMAGLDKEKGEALGISIYKIGMTWPVEPERIKAFTAKFDKVLVVEEKRAFVETQVRNILYNLPADQRPAIFGKQTVDGAPLLNPVGEISPEDVLRALKPELNDLGYASGMQDIMEEAAKKEALAKSSVQKDFRTPFFCSGCPHNTSTKVPEGSRAFAGIGCHFMATKMERDTGYLTQMGGEGVNWAGQSPFTSEEHVFQNLGDGTYYHSGLLAVRQAVASKVNITYKVLYNDAIAMTGGQPLEGPLTVDQISRQLHNEGVKPIVVLTDEPDKYDGWANFAPGVKVYHRDELDKVQRELREIKGVSGLIFDQTCAAEKRRRRKKKQFPDPPKRAFINDLVCEGCGDCSVKSNCVSIVPKQTELGRKRAIDQSSCNKDYSCVNGFCPSFVTVHGGAVRKGSATDPQNFFGDVQAPTINPIDGSYDIMVTGIGGTGVVTIGQIIVMAAHLEGKSASVLDFTGFAQKGGSVTSYIRIAENRDNISAVRVGTGAADLLFGCDMVVAGSPESLRTLKSSTAVILNSQKTQTGQFKLNRDADIHDELIEHNIKSIVGDQDFDKIDANQIATAIMGDSIASNMFMFGFAWQKGKIPVSEEAILRAVELNGVAIESNKRSFNWGRIAAHDMSIITELLIDKLGHEKVLTDLDDIVAYRTKFLTDYQDAKLSERYTALVNKVRTAETSLGRKETPLSEAVAKYYFKLLAIKDEWEVARLYTDGRFKEKLNAQFEGDFKLKFHLAPPLIAPKDDKGQLKKMEFGGWIFSAFKLMAKFRGLRGTKLDIFGYTAERKMERGLITEYEKMVEDILGNLSESNLATALEMASLPNDIRGYGHVKEQSVEESREKLKQLQVKLFSDKDLNTAAE